MSGRKKRSGSRGTVTWGQDSIASPRVRRSQRHSASFNKSSDSPMPAPVMKRSVTAKKIMPRKTLAALASAESQPVTTSTVERSSLCSSSAQPKMVQTAPQSTPKVSNVAAPPRRSSRISPSAGKENVILKSQDIAKVVQGDSTTSKIDILSPIPLNIPQSPTYEDRQKVMSQKVRRSYSRLEMSLNGSSFLYSPTKNTDSSDTSTPNFTSKSGRRSLFGFDKLMSSEDDVENKKVGEKMKETFNESSNGTSMRPSVEEPDFNIPGVAVPKLKRKKRKVPQIKVSALDDWAAAMNAQFDEAEKFDLHVE
ncbi:sororin [Bufo bufo]|uniref:sororin n=1 Tax=Bufo bufo TaxID=8384 RepID=UPI001ABDE1AC|nr:sororin [Bufo bufo]